MKKEFVFIPTAYNAVAALGCGYAAFENSNETAVMSVWLVAAVVFAITAYFAFRTSYTTYKLFKMREKCIDKVYREFEEYDRLHGMLSASDKGAGNKEDK
jgi:hypothetical protein